MACSANCGNVEKHTCEEKNTCRQDVDLYKSTSGTTSVRKGATPVAKTGGGRKRGGERPDSPHQEAMPQATAEQPNGRTDGTRGRDGRAERTGGRAGGNPGEKGGRAQVQLQVDTVLPTTAC